VDKSRRVRQVFDDFYTTSASLMTSALRLLTLPLCKNFGLESACGGHNSGIGLEDLAAASSIWPRLTSLMTPSTQVMQLDVMNICHSTDLTCMVKQSPACNASEIQSRFQWRLRSQGSLMIYCIKHESISWQRTRHSCTNVMKYKKCTADMSCIFLYFITDVDRGL